MFHTENARMLSVFYPNLLISPCGPVLPRWWVGFRVVTGPLACNWGLCGRCAQTPPQTPAEFEIFDSLFWLEARSHIIN